MRYCVLILVCLLMGGCSDAERQKARSKIEVVAEKLAGQTNENGLIPFKGIEENDPWGNEIRVRYTENVNRSGRWEQTVEVRSSGPDGLPFTRDDMVAKRTLVLIGPPKASMAERIEKNSEAISRGFIRGIFKGTGEGIRGK